MNNRSAKEAKLVAETFHADWESGPMARLACLAAAQARRQKRLRQALATATSGVALAAIYFFAVRLHRPAAVPAQVEAVAVLPPATRGYEVISDEELFTALRDQPVLMIRRQDGTHEIRLLESERQSDSSD